MCVQFWTGLSCGPCGVAVLIHVFIPEWSWWKGVQLMSTAPLFLAVAAWIMCMGSHLASQCLWDYRLSAGSLASISSTSWKTHSGPVPISISAAKPTVLACSRDHQGIPDILLRLWNTYSVCQPSAQLRESTAAMTGGRKTVHQIILWMFCASARLWHEGVSKLKKMHKIKLT